MADDAKKDGNASKEKEKENDNSKTDSKDLESQSWYHGMRPRRDVLTLITKQGDWLVRATENPGGTDLVITVMGGDGRRAGNTWCIGKDPAKARTFATVVELVDHYKTRGISRAIQLKRAVARPNWLIKHSQVAYDMTKDKLGAGNFCTVYKGTYQLGTETLDVAIKMTHACANATPEEQSHQRSATKDMMHEAQLMAYYSHVNVLRLYGVACDHPPCLIVAQFCPGGDLLTHLQKFNKDIGIPELILYCVEAAKGMTYLHSMHCVHRDLAARNCLISEKGTIKIADFGLSKLIEEDKKEDAKKSDEEEDNCGQIPLRWTAPECIKVKASDRKYSSKSDVWSYGSLLYEIFSGGEKPFPDDPNKYIATQIRRGKMPPMPERTPDKLKDYVAKSIWQVDPDKRQAMRTIGLFLNGVMNSYPVKEGDDLTLNKIKGVTRDSKHDDTSDNDESDASNDHEKSVDGNGKRKPSAKRGGSHQSSKARNNAKNNSKDDKSAVPK